MKKIAFRLDDVGASSKEFLIYSKMFIGNFLFLKYHWPFKAWAPYAEINVNLWQKIINLFRKNNAKITIGITASWVERDGQLTPFPEKFPKQAAILKKAVKEEIIEIANHGLTHCVVEKHRPRLFLSNRNFHREFWPWIPKKIHNTHLRQSQKILEDYFGVKVITFIPPGNVWTKDTVKYAQEYGIKYISVREKNVFAFHDRDLILHGTKWLEEKIKEYQNKNYKIVQIKDL